MNEEFNPARIKLIIGLGNPGKEYQNTYHNVGFLAVDYLAKNPPNYKSDVYMNESGPWVLKKIKKNGIKPEELLIIHDDSDIKIGNHKFSFGRGAAGHKGIESVIKALRTKNFWRLRIGVRPISPIGPIGLMGPMGPIGRTKAAAFVLKKIKPADKINLETAFREIQNKIVT